MESLPVNCGFRPEKQRSSILMRYIFYSYDEARRFAKQFLFVAQIPWSEFAL